MSNRSNIVCGIQNLKLAQEYFEDFQRQFPATKGAAIFKDYCRRIEWMLSNLATHPALPFEVREGIKKEIASDLLAVPAIAEKIALLTPASRDAFEKMVDITLSGGNVIIES